ncbi:hypothetical protein FQA39_LY15892 [Lamprigera yunnana]|nr:hypothetical protein FQA39_LY15892 [Lamprigera yunnana]
MDGKRNVKLSKTVLDMKFMKKTKERVEKEQDDAEEVSVTSCKDLIEGRLSFGGMNPEIEKLMGDIYKQSSKQEKINETDVSDIEMAQNYSSTVETMGNQFLDKRSRSKKKFLKPSD